MRKGDNKMIFFKYEVFQNAPKATKKSMLVGLLTSWVVLALVVILAGGILGAILQDGLGFDGDGSFYVGFAIGIVLAVLIKRWGKKRMVKIREMAEEEAKRYSEMTEDELQDEEKREEKKIQKGNKIFLMIFFFAIAVFFLILSLATMKPGYINVSETSGSAVQSGKIYFAEELNVEKAYYSINYPYKTRHYAASFTDQDGKEYLVDLDTAMGIENKITKALSKDGENLKEKVSFSGYFEAKEISMDIQDNFDEVSVDDSMGKINVSFSKICNAEDDFFMTVNQANLIMLGIAAVFVLLGVINIIRLKKIK